MREGGRYAAADPSAELAIPEGLRDVVGKRLSRLSPECNRLLAIAAVIGRDFNLETLRTVAGLGPSTSSGRTGIEPARPEALEGPESSTSLREAPDTAEEALLTSLEEALRIGVLEERSRTGQVSYRFAHAFFRQTLYEEMIAPRRLRLHQEVARALETQYGARREEHAAELAEHFAESTDKADLAKAVEYGELAAQRAMSVYAYAEAASHLERCLAVEEILDPEDKKKRCDLLLALGQTLVDAGEFERAAGETAEETFLLAQRIEDPKRACAACKIATRALFVYRAGRAFSTPEYKVWAERYDANAGADDIDRIGADVARANVALGDGRWQDTWNILQQALQRARHVGDSDSLYDVVGRLIAPPHLAENAVARLHLAEEFFSLSREGVPVRALLGFFAGSLYVFRDWGDRARAEQLLHELDVLADRTRYSALVLASGNWHRHFDVVDGRLESIANAAIGPPEIDTPSVSSRIVFNAFKPRLLLGRVSEAMDSLDLFDKFFEGAPAGGGSETEAGMRAVCYAYLGQKERARDLVDQILARADRPGLKPPFVVFVYLLETAVLIGDKSTTTRVLPELKGLGRLTSAQEYNTSVGRVLGEAELLLGHPEKARAHFDEALESCQKLQFRPEIALIRLDLAELLLEHYPDERAAAIEHLDFAISEFREMKMQPSLERALRHRGLLKA